MSTVGSASATGSSNVGSRHATTYADADEDMRSSDTNDRETADSIASTGGEGDANIDDDLANRSVGGYDDRMSDDGSASLVGFGEGANSTVSGPIYHRRPIPGGSSSQGQSHSVPWIPERTVSGLSDLRQEQEEATDYVSYAAEGGATIRGTRHAADRSAYPADDGEDLN